MDWTSLKKSADIALSGITVVIERTDSSISSIVLTDASGHQVRCSSPYGMSIYVPKAPEKKTVHLVKASALDGAASVEERFEQEFEAKERARDLERAGADAVQIVPIEEEIFF
jgi:hypothetical protein